MRKASGRIYGKLLFDTENQDEIFDASRDAGEAEVTERPDVYPDGKALELFAVN